MRAQRGRTKKLIVAFHFYRSDQAGWKCDSCRRAGLERKRRCGWLTEQEQGPAHVIWAKGRAATDTCPKSTISAASLDWIERYLVWRRLGAAYPERLNARDVEAFCVLEQEIEGETRDG